MALTALLLSALRVVPAAPSHVEPIRKSIDFYANFPSRLSDFLLGNNTQVCVCACDIMPCVRLSVPDVMHYVRALYACPRGRAGRACGREPGVESCTQLTEMLTEKSTLRCADVFPARELFVRLPALSDCVQGV